MARRPLAFVLVALALLAVPLPADAALPGTPHASRAYLIDSGPQRGELMARVIARYPQRTSAHGPGPFYGYTEITLRGPGGSLQLHDLDRLAHPRHAEQVDHRIELSRSRTARLLGTKGGGATLRITTRSVVLGPLARSTRARASELATAPRTTVTMPLHQVTAYPPNGGRLLASSRGWLTIGYALEPNTTGTYDALVMSFLPPQGRVLLTDLTVPGNGTLRVETADGLRPAGDADFGATFDLTAPLPGGCTGSASGRIDAISANYGQTFDFDHATFTSTWSSYQLFPLCSTPVSGRMQSLAGGNWVAY